MSVKSALRHIQVITFDVHNVLLTVRNGAPHQYARLAREHIGMQSVDESALRTRFFEAFRALNVSHPGYGVHTNISSRQWWTLLIEHTFKDHRLPSEQLERLSRIIYDEFAKGELWVKHPQADEVLRELKSKKPLGVISNFDERLESLLEQHGLREHFRFVLTPRNCGMYKPQSTIFAHAAKLGGAEANGSLCHVGDDVKLDYQAGQTAGCHVLLLAKDEASKQKLLQEETTIERNDVITSLKELLSIFS